MLVELIQSQEVLALIPLALVFTAATSFALGGSDKPEEGRFSGLKFRAFGRILSLDPVVAIFWAELFALGGLTDTPHGERLLIGLIAAIGSWGIYSGPKALFFGKKA